MPKVLRIINRFNIGGPAYNVSLLTKHLAPEYETLLIGGEKEADEDSSLFIFHEMNIQPLVLEEMSRSVHFFNDIRAYFRIKKIIKEFKPDIVHTHAAKAGALGRLAAHSCKVPVIIHTFHGHVFHSYFGVFKTYIYKQIERFLAKKSTAIIAISEKQKQELCETYKIVPPHKTHIIPLGFDLSKFTDKQTEKRTAFRKQYLIEEDEICIAIIGRLAPVKNHSLFLKAIAHAKKHSAKKIRAIIVGDGSLRSTLMQQCVDIGLDYSYFLQEPKKATVIFTSWIQDVSFPLAGSDVVCLTSFNEGTPVSLIEAEAAGKAIVTTKVGGIENSVSQQAAFLVDVTNENLFFEKVLLLCNNPNIREEMASYGKDFVLKKYHYTRLVQDVKQLYEKYTPAADKTTARI
ncbi:MAG: glycosyltransferase [Bacteroidetes bacterium]|nr:glycosyltransferase [Bacteroidota bacterium]